ncbi:MAG: pyridoxamine 5'-phosphate oxidase family protein, partial [Egibacteraceae bacterium]
QELWKYPPSRLLADSRLLRREHWWYLPRLLAVFEPGDSHPVALQPDDGGVLAWQAEDRLRAVPVSVDRPGNPVVAVRGDGLPERADQALVACHDFAVPDRERATTLTLAGRLDGSRLHVTDRDGSARLPAPPGLLSRIRRQRDLRRRCCQALAAARATG